MMPEIVGCIGYMVYRASVVNCAVPLVRKSTRCTGYWISSFFNCSKLDDMSFFIISMFIVAAMAYAVDDAYFSSCRAGDVHAVKSFLDSGVSVHARDAKGNTGLIIASGRGQIEVIQLLLSYGATVEDASLIGIFEGKTAIW